MNKKHIYVRLLEYTRPYFPRLFAALGCMVLASVFTVIPPWLLKNVVDDVLIAKKMDVLNVLTIGLVLLFTGKGIASYGHQYLMNWVGQHVVMDLRVALYDHMQNLSLRYIYGKRVGELMSRITNDVNVLQNMVTTVIVDLVVQGITFLGMLGFLIYINWRLTLITFAILPLTFFILDHASKKLRFVGHAIQEELARLSAIIQEALSAIRIVRSFVTEAMESQRFKDQNRANFKALMHGVQVQAALSGVIEVVLIAALALILWIGGRDVINEKLTPGELIAFLGYLGFLVHPIRVFTRVVSSMQLCLASAERIFSIFDTPCEIRSPEHPVPLGVIQGAIKMEDVWFAYKDEQWVLKGVALEVCPGERVAVVGETGGGKSTLMDLIPRFYDPSRGKVSVDGCDVRTLDLTELRKQIGIVPQDPVLMKGSLAFNISYGFPQATEEDIVKAAQIAGIHTFITSLPEEYDTEVGERGVTLSGGQRQRVAIARAIIRNPRILILDEATSSLDVAVESQIQEAMEKAMEGRTSFVIAHRLSTVRSADRILVLSKGHIVESGTHDELLEKGGIYRHLYELQFGGEKNNETRP
jgi:subfamily B ATP-binding cassette protein MsbA